MAITSPVLARWARSGLLALVLAACGDGGGVTEPPGEEEEAPHTVEVTPGTAEVIAGRQVRLTAVARNPGGQPVGGRHSITWSSSNANVARVDAEGVVTAVAAGTATVTATFTQWAKSGSVQVTVQPRTLRAFAAERGFRIGAAVAVTGTTFPTNAAYVAALRREMNAVVAENVMKWDAVRRDGPASWRFEAMDGLVDFAAANGMTVRGHPLAWHSGIPAWLQALTPATTTREQAIALLTQHVDSVVTRYRGRIRDYDVVNEVIADGGGGGRRPAAESVWERLIGPDWVDVAFRAAAEADPNARLFYNDYAIETNNPKQTAVFNLVKGLKDRGVRVDGVGFQAHFVSGQVPTEAQLMASMDRFAALGLAVQITELDVRIQSPLTPAKLEAQAEEYRRVVRVCIAHPACDTVMIWGLDDGNSWVPHFFPGWGAATLFDAALSPKPAYFAVQDELDAQ